jgi:hypothetical protein
VRWWEAGSDAGTCTCPVWANPVLTRRNTRTLPAAWMISPLPRMDYRGMDASRTGRTADS